MVCVRVFTCVCVCACVSYYSCTRPRYDIEFDGVLPWRTEGSTWEVPEDDDITVARDGGEGAFVEGMVDTVLAQVRGKSGSYSKTKETVTVFSHHSCL